ncbi:4-hydroxybenzoate polyprenyltransferase, mitochondrial-like [Dendronephthya gigantea]|uniref:4-hydroxybenzoate polyprenyltransferase, mitochondrial-like n=1 Tax=Dendronephthya gigantea TaxID=151771 RepID=UPI00106BB0FB|nr:4-hydroxybenzoate polyprenyltransferase, mitochondrial-like [Dendronephthya gigantea]
MIWLTGSWKKIGTTFKSQQQLLMFTGCNYFRYVFTKLSKHQYGTVNIMLRPFQHDRTCSRIKLNSITTFQLQNSISHQDKHVGKPKNVFFQNIHNGEMDVKQCRYLTTDNSNSDINQSWIAKFPKSVQPYLVMSRMDRPIGYWLLFLPGAWSISLAADAGSIPNIHLLSLFFVGAVLMRTSGCVINDMLDADLDRKVARTSTRPIASGDITHLHALIFLASTLSISLGILLSLNQYSIVLGASSLFLVASYPLMKRITYWPQLALGFTFNWGCLLGWSAVTGSLDLTVCLPLYAAAVNWTMLYDTIYAFQDVEDDRWIGVKSTALLFGDHAKPCLTGFAAVVIANLIAVGVNTSQTWPYYLGLIAVTSHLTWQVATVDLSVPKDCLSKFKSNRWLGIILWMSIVMATLWKSDQENTERAGKTTKQPYNL